MLGRSPRSVFSRRGMPYFISVRANTSTDQRGWVAPSNSRRGVTCTGSARHGVRSCFDEKHQGKT
jgi:hypothetical protein